MRRREEASADDGSSENSAVVDRASLMSTMHSMTRAKWCWYCNSAASFYAITRERK
jgi:hypothetical protein